MRLRLSLPIGLAALVSGAFAGTPIVSITSVQPFTLDGTPVASPGVTSWPMIVSDDLATIDGAALLKFKDGSTVNLLPKTQVRLVGTDQAPKLILVAGSLDYKIVAGSRLSIVTADKKVQETAADPIPGKAQAGPAVSGAGPSMISIRNTAIYYGAASGSLAALGVATAALLQPGPVSPQ